MVDLVSAASAVVLPALETVFREGEVTTFALHSRAGNLRLTLTVEGETFEDNVIQADVPGQSYDDWRERLRSNLVDFVAESRFGWGQNRDRQA